MTVKFITMGCKTNFYESQAMAELFRKRGFEITEGQTADVFVVNTCAVTSIGAQKSRQQISKVKRKNPDAVVVAVGCLAQTDTASIEKIGVDVIVGNDGKGDVPRLAEEALDGKKSVDCGDIMKVRRFEELCLVSSQSRIRANVKIEDGCDNFCAYCIIPYARGPVRSRSLEKIVEEVRLLAQNGYIEIVLTGIHIGSYGKDLKNGMGLIDVVEAVCGVEGINRVRLGSVEPVAVTDEFVERISRLPNLCPQFHLSLQSGCTETLRRMKRRYTAEEYFDAVQRLREKIEDVSITTDLMVGFPGETDEEFRKSYEFCKSIGFMQMHVFKYSVRKGTVAEKMENQVPEQIKEERSRRMLELSDRMKEDFYNSFKGRELEVLAETKTPDGRYHATAANYMEFFVESDEDITGKTVIHKIQ
ncbi:MAG: tRNA (N(6)-L-threonylcarbamoyladenosine(37)-C(2))-methylthiotransferase MtaB [Ruminococcaceae bacterium]|nr:tRNA (N(6)-L-threonylcarbamoyladenosine(37)-C(2))-methylthiotransferase MtaB [Oscillospiraceae bacterium]